MGDEINNGAHLLRTSFLIHKLNTNASWKSRNFSENFSVQRTSSDHLIENISRLEIYSELVPFSTWKSLPNTEFWGRAVVDTVFTKLLFLFQPSSWKFHEKQEVLETFVV